MRIFARAAEPLKVHSSLDLNPPRAGHGRHARRYARPATERTRLLEERVAAFAAALTAPVELAAFQRLGETRYLIAGSAAGFTPDEVAVLRSWWPSRRLEHQGAARAYWRARRARVASAKVVGR